MKDRVRVGLVGSQFILTVYEELWNYGFPKELARFVDCVKHDKQPAVTGEDGRAVPEALFAAYASAGLGRKI